MQSKPILFFAVVGLLAAYTIANYTGGSGAPIGSIAPDFELKDADGNLVKLSDYRGKLVFLNFWATWCEPCVWEMPLMMRLHDTLKDRGFEILTVSVDTSWKPIEDFYDQNDVSFPTLLDPAQAVSRGRYKVTAFPETFLIAEDGHVLSHVIGPRRWDDPREVAEIEQYLDRAGRPTNTSNN